MEKARASISEEWCWHSSRTKGGHRVWRYGALQQLPRMPRGLNSLTKRQKPLVRTALFGWVMPPSFFHKHILCCDLS